MSEPATIPTGFTDPTTSNRNATVTNRKLDLRLVSMPVIPWNRAVIFSSIVGIGIFYLIDIVLGFFGVRIPFMQWGDNSLIGIGVNLFIVVIAALSLVLNFDQIETGEKMGAPKYMEWYGAFGLLVTLVWLYLEILQLLSRFSNNRN